MLTDALDSPALEVPEGWECAPLGDLVEEERGISYGIVQPGQHDDNGVPIVRVNNLRTGRILIDDVLRVSAGVEANYSRTRLRGGEVLLSLVGTVGECAVVPKELAGWNVARAVAVIPPRADIDPHWLAMCLRSGDIQSLIRAWATTTVQATLNLRDVRRLPILIAPEPDRSSITQAIKQLEAKIEQNRRSGRALENLARATFKAWFVDFEPVKAKAAGQTSFRGMPPAAFAALPDRFTNSPLGPVPEGWQLKTAGDVVKRLSVGKKFDQKTVKAAGAIPVLDQSVDGIIGYHDEAPGVEASVAAPVAVFANHTCNMRLLHKSFSTIQNVLPFVGESVNTLWAYFGLLSRQKVIEYKGHWPDFILQELVVPPETLTHFYGDIVRSLTELKWALESESTKLATLRDYLLPKLLSGRVRVREAEKNTDHT
ncbi:MAG TPA: restriction endonuclease subunit S [Methylomirabilota bacterium]|nr:restriction endonuclease subunit S [Methylomirabilota bacterium]